MIKIDFENNINHLPLSLSTQNLLLDDLIKNDNNFLNLEIYDFLNFSFYSGLANHNIDILNFTEIVQTFKLYISINSSEAPIFFFKTIYKSLIQINKHLDEPENLFKSEKFLHALLIFFEFFPILNSIVNKSPLDEEMTKCSERMSLLHEKISELNKRLNHFNKEEVIFY